jgi:hypothetical protein
MFHPSSGPQVPTKILTHTRKHKNMMKFAAFFAIIYYAHQNKTERPFQKVQKMLRSMVYTLPFQKQLFSPNFGQKF